MTGSSIEVRSAGILLSFTDLTRYDQAKHYREEGLCATQRNQTTIGSRSYRQKKLSRGILRNMEILRNNRS